MAEVMGNYYGPSEPCFNFSGVKELANKKGSLFVFLSFAFYSLS